MNIFKRLFGARAQYYMALLGELLFVTTLVAPRLFLSPKIKAFLGTPKLKNKNFFLSLRMTAWGRVFAGMQRSRSSLF